MNNNYITSSMKLFNIFLLVSIFVLSNAADIEELWVISLKTVRPDGVAKTVPVVNGQYPGPELRGKAGQSVRIEVRNQLPSDSATIHWHGIKQTGTVWADGVPGITQCPIEAGETFIYEFNLDGPGTLWWHSHFEFQKSSLYGAITVEGDEKDVPFYDEERIILLNDWFHQDADTVAQNLLTPLPNFSQPTFNSLLFNGKGVFDCASDPSKDCDPSHPDAGPFVLNVDPGKTYRLRIIGAATDSFINLGIEKHQMQMIETETTLIKPFRTDYVEVHAGQSYSVILRTKSFNELRKMKNNNGQFWIQMNTQPFMENLRSFAILKYSTSTAGDDPPIQPTPEWTIQNDPNWSLKFARRQKSLKTVTDLPKRADRVFTVVATLNFQEMGRVNWALNNISYVDGGTTILHAIKLNLNSETDKYVEQTTIPVPFDYRDYLNEGPNDLPLTSNIGTHVIKVKKDEVIDFVFQNAALFSRQKSSHPIHLHLHNFWVMGYGDQDGSAWTRFDEKKYDRRTPVSRNTFTLFQDSWTAIRVKFDNTGVAHMHCHINPHLWMGMALNVQIGDSNQIPDLPANTKFCGTAL